MPQLWEAVHWKDGTTASWPDWSTSSEAHHYGAGTREENTWSTTEGEKQPSGGVRLRDCLSSGCKQGMQSALRGWWLFGADEGEDKESPERFRGGVYQCFEPCVMYRIMYELAVCSDGMTEAQPRSFRQNRPASEYIIWHNAHSPANRCSGCSNTCTWKRKKNVVW